MIHKTERTALKNAQVVLKLNDTETMGVYTNELGNFSFTISLEKYPLANLELAVMVGFETYFFHPKDFEGKYLMVCEVAPIEAENVTVICAAKQIWRREVAISGAISVQAIYVAPSRWVDTPSHYYTMEAQIKNMPTVYVKE